MRKIPYTLGCFAHRASLLPLILCSCCIGLVHITLEVLTELEQLFVISLMCEQDGFGNSMIIFECF